MYFSIIADLFAFLKMTQSYLLLHKEDKTLIDELNTNLIWAVLTMGIGATLVIDLWAAFLQHRLGITGTNWTIVGRWVAGIPHGRFRLQSGLSKNPIRYELQLGWFVHYIVGIGYALAYLFIMCLISAPVSLSSALSFGLITLLAPWLIMMPALGKGWFAGATPRPATTRLLNLVAHLLFGAGLYFMWRIFNTINL